MPKFEEEPGRYSEKRPHPGDRGRTTKRFRSVRSLADDDVERAARETRSTVRERWQTARPEALKTLEDCAECQRSLSEVRWQLQIWDEEENRQELEPLYEPCGQHPGIFHDWITERLETLHRFLEGEG